MARRSTMCSWGVPSWPPGGPRCTGGPPASTTASATSPRRAFTARPAGPHDGRWVLLLHGFPQTSWCWRAQLSALGDAGYRAVAPDQRGDSAGARPPAVGDYALRHLVAG